MTSVPWIAAQLICHLQQQSLLFLKWLGVTPPVAVFLCLLLSSFRACHSQITPTRSPLDTLPLRLSAMSRPHQHSPAAPVSCIQNYSQIQCNFLRHPLGHLEWEGTLFGACLLFQQRCFKPSCLSPSPLPLGSCAGWWQWYRKSNLWNHIWLAPVNC